MDWMPQAIRDGIFTVLFISGPLVLLAAALGLVIGIIQAATQVQEQTLGSAVKILGVFLALIVFGFYMFQYLKQYTTQTINRAFNLVPTLSSHPLPPKKLLSQPIKEETDNPLFSPEEIAAAATPSSGAGQSAKAMNDGALPEEPDVVEVPAEPVTDKLPPQFNFLQRPPSGLRETVIENLMPPEPPPGEEGEEEHTHEEPAARPAATPARAPVTSTPVRPASTPAPRTATPTPAATKPATTTARPVATPSARPAATAAARPPAAATRPATPVAKPTPAAPAAPIETAPVPVNPTPNSDLAESRSRARAALARIKSSINETQAGATAGAE